MTKVHITADTLQLDESKTDKTDMTGSDWT